MQGRFTGQNARQNPTFERYFQFSREHRAGIGLCVTARAIKLARNQSCVTRIDPIMSYVRLDVDARSLLARINGVAHFALHVNARDPEVLCSRDVHVQYNQSLISGVEACHGVAAHRGHQRPFRIEVRRYLQGYEGFQGRAARQEAEEQPRQIPTSHSRKSRLLRQG